MDKRVKFMESLDLTEAGSSLGHPETLMVVHHNPNP